MENVDLLKKTLELGKKPNMAASGINTAIEEAILMLSEESQEEPSLLEIKNILIDIQIQLSAILKENIHDFHNGRRRAGLGLISAWKRGQ